MAKDNRFTIKDFSKPKVSLIIPVHNEEIFLTETLSSVANQTLKEIEIICIDDCSSNSSLQILEKYAKSDNRINVIPYDLNQSASRCRKDGVMAATGQYIMFVDGDDYLEPNACEIAYKSIIHNNSDVLQFGTIIENCCEASEEKKNNYEQRLLPYPDPIHGNLLESCFLERKFCFNLWNKIYKADVCRSAFERIEDGFFAYADDLYAAYFILDNSRSYSSIKNKIYHHSFGRETSGGNSISVDSFKTHCMGGHVVRAIENDVKNEKDPDIASLKQNVLLRIKEQLSGELVSIWINNVEEDDKSEAFSLMMEHYGNDRIFIVSELAESGSKGRWLAARYAKNSNAISLTNRRVETVALYYRNIHNGGAQRIVAMLCNMLADIKDGDSKEKKNKYRIILVTDEESNENDYYLSENVIRAIIPEYRFSENTYYDRAEALSDLIEKYEIDLFINSLWLAQNNIWDLLTIKSHPRHPAYAFHSHNCFGMLYGEKYDAPNYFSLLYSLADAVIVLSQTDKNYWSLFNDRVYMINNPNGFTAKEKQNNENHDFRILWLGRISEEKNPLEMIHIAKKVVSKYPEIKCDIVGEDDSLLCDKMHKLIVQEKLTDNVFMHSFTNNVNEFYEKASVFCMTSQREGMPLTLLESASFSLPIVMYDLPWLENYARFPHIIRVNQKDSLSAAQEIIRIYTDSEYREQLSKAIHDEFVSYQKKNVIDDWEIVFRDLEKTKEKADSNTSRNDYYYNSIYEINMFHKELISRFKELESSLKQNEEEINKIRSSGSYRLGSFIIHFPRRIKNKLFNK